MTPNPIGLSDVVARSRQGKAAPQLQTHPPRAIPIPGPRDAEIHNTRRAHRMAVGAPEYHASMCLASGCVLRNRGARSWGSPAQANLELCSALGRRFLAPTPFHPIVLWRHKCVPMLECRSASFINCLSNIVFYPWRNTHPRLFCCTATTPLGNATWLYNDHMWCW